MASLLSEGGYHTIASQQQLNINADYKRLEAFAAFQSILKFRNMTNPEQTFLAGIIKNSENDVPIDGVTVKVGRIRHMLLTHGSRHLRNTPTTPTLSTTDSICLRDLKPAMLSRWNLRQPDMSQ